MTSTSLGKSVNCSSFETVQAAREAAGQNRHAGTSAGIAAVIVQAVGGAAHGILSEHRANRGNAGTPRRLTSSLDNMQAHDSRIDKILVGLVRTNCVNSAASFNVSCPAFTASEP